MKKLFDALRLLILVALISPLALAWLPPSWLSAILPGEFLEDLVASFRQLSVTLGAALGLALVLTIILGYVSVLSHAVGRGGKSVLDAVESIPAILIALFCYAPIAIFLAQNDAGTSSAASLLVFILAATLTALPEAVRGVAIPLGELYHRKYSLSFRSYGFTKAKILAILMNSRVMRGALKRSAAGILLKTLVLDTSFGFIIQVGFGSYGTPAHASPGALIAANRVTLMAGQGDPVRFWLPAIALIAISTAFLLVLGEEKETNA